MTKDNVVPSDEGRKSQARRLAEQAVQAQGTGDEETADRLFAEAEKLDPGAVEDVLEEDESLAGRQHPRPARAVPLRASPDLQAKTAVPAVGLGAWQAKGSAGAPRGGFPHPTTFTITLRVNGEDRELSVDARTTLLDALRDRLHLTGTKKGCALGQCGACTVLLDRDRIHACLMLAVMALDKEVTTIEGLAKDGQLHPLQQAFIDHDAFQCGYCTPGQIMSGVALLAEGRTRSEEEIREQMSGNICRCGAYPNIIAAIEQAVQEVQ
jgi:xanthine dehydrogenase YagT iron-sulfur-binding subunit